MSLDLSVLMNKRMTKKFMEAVESLLRENNFHKDEYGYVSAKEDVYVHIYVNLAPEKDEWWDDMDELVGVIGFFPKAEISLESRHTKESHTTNYVLAGQLAKLVNGVIYDYQVGVLYDSDGKPYACHRTDDEFEEYGAGMSLSMAAVGIVKDVLGTENKM
ncbi:MAG: hypothetical protein JRF43_07565 [Deltaproteobacteria bacterium]|nr:hypothetical protein [Deltaproteobacteria bacterium]